MEKQHNTTSKIISSFIAECFPLALIKQFDDRTDLMRAGIIDSFGILELLTFVETTFEIRIDDADITEEHFSSIGAMSSYIESKRSHLMVKDH